MLRLQIEWDRSEQTLSGVHIYRAASRRAEARASVNISALKFPRSTFHLPSPLSGVPWDPSRSLHFIPPGCGDSASSADPTFGYHLQTWIADAASGTSDTTNTQHGLTALARGFSSPAAESAPCPAPRSRLAARQMVLLLQPRRRARSRSAALWERDPDPPGTLAMGSLISSTDLS